ncbi:MAG: hypothetical protein LPK07_01850 [Hymenobacteraceae bacterium]|nr:hypothetical protein [Hymenobacteraceae bacterium]
MSELRIELDLQPSVLESDKKVTFYRGLAAFFFLVAVVYLFLDFAWHRLPLFLLLAYIGYRIYISATGSDYLRIMSNSYLLIDDKRFVLKRSQVAILNSDGASATTIYWSDVEQLEIGPLSFVATLKSGKDVQIALDYLTEENLHRVQQQLQEIKARYHL